MPWIWQVIKRSKLNKVALTCGGIPCVKFRQGSSTILSIDLYKDHYVFQIVFGKTEQEKFGAARHEFSTEMQGLYNSTHTYREGKRLFIRVDNLYTLLERRF
ncbi:MAG: DUF3788 family protein [Oscillospiraceae bacterium]|nr:DUF3788 family protein [Oscillospiraceae bacterium]